ncbi:MAG: hypothetical protein U5J78_02980 [Parasphingorhabdus sp.]|nr:hypothetical protein [Parasphingorhabdus sp.]
MSATTNDDQIWLLSWVRVPLDDGVTLGGGFGHFSKSTGHREKAFRVS